MSIVNSRASKLRLNTHLHQLLLVVELQQQDIFSIRHSGQRDSQPPARLVVAIGWQRAPQHLTHNLNQVEGGMHGPEEPLPGLLCHVNDARTSLA